MAIDINRHFVPYVVGLAPALLVLLAWAPAGDWTDLKLFTRNFSAPIVGAELFAILVAAREGMLKAVPRWSWSRPALAAIFVLLAIAVATAYAAPLKLRGAFLTLYWIVHGLFGVSILFLTTRLFQAADVIRAYMVGFAAFFALFVVYLFQIPDWSAFDWKRGFLAFSHIRHPGYYLAAMAAMAIGVMAVARHRAEWTWAFLCASAATGMALWTGSRGAVFAVVGAMVAGILFSQAFRNVRGIGGGAGAMALAAAVASQLPVPFHMMGFSRMVGATTGGDVTTGRTRLWEIALDAIRERPIFGYGEGQMREVATFSDMVQPHNIVLQIALAWGVVGLLCVIVLAVAYCRRAIPAIAREADPVVPAFMTMAALAVLSLYDGALHYPLPVSIFAACGAIIASRWSSTVVVGSKAAPLAAAAK